MKVRMTGGTGSNTNNNGGGSSDGKTDHRYTYCYEAKAAGLGPYHRGVDPEYAWYRDNDGDGVVCE
jgi:micrococcal nuclease